MSKKPSPPEPELHAAQIPREGRGRRAGPRPASLLLAGILAAISANAGPSYLKDGPPPIRFRVPPPVTGPIIALPPLAMSDPPRAGDGDTPQTTPVATAVAPAGAARSDPASTGVAQGQASSVTSAAGTTGRPPRPGPPPTLEVMSPQLLVPYLTDSSVPPPAHAIVAPLTFMPPQPGVTASSRATYQVAP